MVAVDAQDLRLSDKVRRDWYLMRLSLRLAGLPQRMERNIRHQLKVEIGDAAAEQGMHHALTQLGRPHVLAEEYLAAHGRPVPKVWTGIAGPAPTLFDPPLGYPVLADMDRPQPDHCTAVTAQAWMA